jgi:hypothetical protein
MLDMRRLHLRGAANRGICVDVEGAMLGPHCVLVNQAVTLGQTLNSAMCRHENICAERVGSNNMICASGS